MRRAAREPGPRPPGRAAAGQCGGRTVRRPDGVPAGRRDRDQTSSPPAACSASATRVRTAEPVPPLGV
ncbi:hypothetical protein GCM10010406_28270 [Streptomyces thermolineatus]|uniref:Uncharacterized protein n=1 Tax=Streptomyces thermolineatus TaxID=44033 RepID=A0ABP5Z1E2_9ACTN